MGDLHIIPYNDSNGVILGVFMLLITIYPIYIKKFESNFLIGTESVESINFVSSNQYDNKNENEKQEEGDSKGT